KGTILGGPTDDPGREHTGNAAARAQAGDAGRRQRGVPRDGHLAHVVLSVASALPALWPRRSASTPAARPAWACAATAAGRGAPDLGGGDRGGDVGRRAPRRLRVPALAAACGAEHRPATAAAPWLGHAPAAPAGPRAS